jgi:hypothetical protein
LRCDLVDVYYALYGTKEPAAFKNPELASLYQPKKVDVDKDEFNDIDDDDDNLKIEMVDAKLDEQQPGIAGIEVVTESMEEHNTDSMIIEEPLSENIVEPKIETDDFNQTIVDASTSSLIVQTIQSESERNLFVSESGETSSQSKRLKLDYGSDSQSQPSIDLNEINAGTLENVGVKEHKVNKSTFNIWLTKYN